MGLNAFTGDRFFLSNFYPCEVRYNDMTYQSSEAAYQAAKFPSHPDSIQREFCKANASAAKHLSRIYGPRRPDWDVIKNGVMLEVLRAKFRNPKLRQMLLDTNDDLLEEANDWGDRYWGTVSGQGLNTLGVMLMELRSQFRDEGSSGPPLTLLVALTPYLRHDVKCDYFSDKDDSRCTCGLDGVIKSVGGRGTTYERMANHTTAP